MNRNILKPSPGNLFLQLKQEPPAGGLIGYELIKRRKAEDAEQRKNIHPSPHRSDFRASASSHFQSQIQ
jgi:hypothetical protein